jgi:flagellar motility protein MotE (MotC chaperone)
MRLIPLTIAAASFFFAVKLLDVIRGTEAVSEAFFVSRVEAQSEPKTEATTAASGDATQSSGAKAEAAGADPNAPGDPAAKAQSKQGEKKDAPNPNVKETPGEVADRSFTKVELELLQNLAKRREELELWETNIQLKETALDATEKRINDKIAQIEAMKKEVSELLAEYNSKEDAEIRSLVRIYENMKPRDAARIFDELEMPVLLMVVDKMSEKKAAPILAEMSPQKAKAVTVQLAAQRQINNAKFNTISAAPSNPNPPAASSPTPQ